MIIGIVLEQHMIPIALTDYEYNNFILRTYKAVFAGDGYSYGRIEMNVLIKLVLV